MLNYYLDVERKNSRVSMPFDHSDKRKKALLEFKNNPEMF